MVHLLNAGHCSKHIIFNNLTIGGCYNYHPHIKKKKKSNQCTERLSSLAKVPHGTKIQTQAAWFYNSLLINYQNNVQKKLLRINIL